MTLAAEIDAAIRASGLSGTQVAKRIRRNGSWVTRARREGTDSLIMVGRLETALGLEPGVLLRRAGVVASPSNLVEAIDAAGDLDPKARQVLAYVVEVAKAAHHGSRTRQRDEKQANVVPIAGTVTRVGEDSARQAAAGARSQSGRRTAAPPRATKGRNPKKPTRVQENE